MYLRLNNQHQCEESKNVSKKKKWMRQCLECAVHPQGKLGGCTVISCGVTLNYTTYYLNLRNTGANPSRNKINPKNVSTISKTPKSCRASLAFAKCPFLAGTAKQVYAAKGYYTAVRAALIHWPISDIL